jgi:NitT/TauT family transport system ATP-binding protein
MRGDGEMLEVRALRKEYGEHGHGFTAVGDVSFTVEEGEFVTVVGPSGCGKTTLLRCVAGLLTPSAGEVVLRGERVVSPPEGLAVVFQEYGRSLLPWLCTRHNIELPLRARGLPARRRAELVSHAVESVGLTASIDRYPWQLSGGMQQRVAIARALACEPTLLLMDEPFASVDAQTRADLEDLTLRVRREYGVTVLLVTHDIDEAVYLGDRVVILERSPSRVRDVIDVDLPAKRDQVETKALPAFAALRTAVYARIRAPRGDEPLRLALSPAG